MYRGCFENSFCTGKYRYGFNGMEKDDAAHEQSHREDVVEVGDYNFYSRYISDYFELRDDGLSKNEAYHAISTEGRAYGAGGIVDDFFSISKNKKDFYGILYDANLSEEQKVAGLEALAIDRIQIPQLQKKLANEEGNSLASVNRRMSLIDQISSLEKKSASLKAIMEEKIDDKVDTDSNENESE